MNIDTEKFIELLVEATGIEEEKIRKQMGELIQEIKDALAQGDAYEVDGFGIFTGFGSNVTFLPSSELETELNYKYAGMEPIELDDEVEVPDMADEDESLPMDSASNPFAGLIDDEDLAELDAHEAKAEQGATEELESEILETHIDSTDDLLDDPFAVSDEEETTEIEEPAEEEESSESIFELETTEEETVDEVEETEEAEEDLSLELDMGDEPGPEEEVGESQEAAGSEKWGIDSYKDDSAESVFGSLLGDEIKDVETEGPGGFTTEDETDIDLSEEEQEIMAGMEEAMEDSVEDLDDNPFEEVNFANLESDTEATEEKAPAKEDTDDLFPVIRDVSSDLPDVEPEPEPELVTLDEEAVEETEKKKSSVTSMILAAAIIVISLGALGWGAIQMDFIDLDQLLGKEEAVTMLPPPQPQQQPVNNRDLVDNSDSESLGGQPIEQPTTDQAPVQQQPVTQPETSPEAVDQPVQTETTQPEQSTETVVQEVPSQPATPIDETDLGMYNQATTNMSGVWSVVLFSLTSEQNARAKVSELESAGLKARLTTLPSSQYGTLYRVSIGHFTNITDAAIAIDDLGSPYNTDYFIVKI